MNQQSGMSQRNSRSGQNSSQQGFINSLTSTFQSILGLNSIRSDGRSRSPTLPTDRFNASVQNPTDPLSTSSENLFLLLCLPYQRHATKLIQMDLRNLLSDQLFFTELQLQYQSMRGRWTSLFSLRKLARIRFVRFELHRKELVDIHNTHEIIPPENKKSEYRYEPMPAETIPPVGENYMMHLYDHPEDADEATVCLGRIPKKLREQLKVCPQRRTGLGWGVHFVEGFHWTKFWILGVVGLFVCVGFGVSWSKIKHDVQGGFSITACMMVGLTFTTGIVQAALDPK